MTHNLKFFTLLLLFFICAKGISQNRILTDFIDSQVSAIMSEWIQEGYWGDAKRNYDNRYNEAILLSILQEKAKRNDEKFLRNLRKTFYYSIDNFQDINGFFLQEKRPSHVRTSLFLKCIAQAVKEYPNLSEDEKIMLSVKNICKALEVPHPFSFNQNIAAMMALFSMYEVNQDKDIYNRYMMYRELLLKSFIKVDSKKGYWPEAPDTRKNRLNKPYLFVQSMMLQEYLNLKKDLLMEKAHRQLNSFIYSNIDLDKVHINVENSLGNFKQRNIKSIPISVASFFWMEPACSSLNENQRKRILKKCISNFEQKIESNDIVRYTDLYYRFAMIKELTKK